MMIHSCLRSSRLPFRCMVAHARSASLTYSVPVLAPADMMFKRSSGCGVPPRQSSTHEMLLTDAGACSDLAYCLSFANDESDFNSNLSRLFDVTMRDQLDYRKKISLYRQQNVLPADIRPLPRTLQEAQSQASRAIVITEVDKPFRVVDVNQTWEGLCGYSFIEAKGKTLGSLLRGDETDQLAATALVSRLIHGEEAGATLTNYTKARRRFRNRLRVGPIVDETTGRVTHFVGVLQEIHDEL
ncbi:hypothetical protein MPSEU_000480000 [Mayamaea pseudoterrestris]|nr:hypothetical protein MPSEU_000480000 [Mayamaea pseudoterrestris]